MRLTSIPYAALLMLCLSVGSAGADTLTDALASAYWTNPDINVARAQTRITDESLPIATSALRPNISGSGSITRTTRDAFSGSTGKSGTDTTDGSIGLKVTQNLFRGLRTKNARLEADASIAGSRQSLAGIVQDVLFDAAQAYMLYECPARPGASGIAAHECAISR